MTHFGDSIVESSIQKNSAVIVGLDPIIEHFPKVFLPTEQCSIEESIFEFNKLVIDTVHPYIVAVKPQLAFYEVYGSAGIRALEKTIAYARYKELLVINDAKRGDIYTTGNAYAEAFLGKSPISGDAVTVNPFLGRDGIIPFIEKGREYGKGLFILLKTSNPSSGEIQDLILQSGEKLYSHLATMIQEMSVNTIGIRGYSNIGVVIGATYPEVASKVRDYLPNTLFLVPGFGEQGGSLQNLRPFFNKKGEGALVNSARGIIYSYQKAFPETWSMLDKETIKKQILNKVIDTNNKINEIRK